MIACHFCKFTSTFRQGTKDEKLFYRVMDTTSNGENSTKNFYCNENCYLDSFFTRYVAKEIGVGYLNFNWNHLLNSDLEDYSCDDSQRRFIKTKLDEFEEKYDDIVESVRDSYGLQKYRAENQSKIYKVRDEKRKALLNKRKSYKNKEKVEKKEEAPENKAEVHEMIKQEQDENLRWADI